jgi:hypothetical protein
VAAGSGSGQRLRSQAVAAVAPAAYKAMAAASRAIEMAASGAGMPPKRWIAMYSQWKPARHQPKPKAQPTSAAPRTPSARKAW